ncbi:MAG: hypothetical protein BWK72_11545 [Rhodoferax ferrireducens]|uniref:KilA-N DNA-binding domain-containing protein n=1 Tax=Rhodoferax ferrireducens TaxID=192843 RepID=A0A1W9KTV1_9BURK|nr:MAG: hypothetical protein BWK72_11545 [Rhodoferax ferrireducens]
MYEVETKRFNEQIKRNLTRFPADFMFRLTEEEFESLRSQFATSKRGGRRYLPLAFTEHGAIMAAMCAQLRPGGGDERVCGARLCVAACRSAGPQSTGRQAGRVGAPGVTP